MTTATRPDPKPTCSNCGKFNIYFTRTEIVCRGCGHREPRP